jgi:hypothetical protein
MKKKRKFMLELREETFFYIHKKNKNNLSIIGSKTLINKTEIFKN